MVISADNTSLFVGVENDGRKLDDAVARKGL